MNAVRGLLRDLIERKLWPVAVLLLLAAIAVPVYLGRSSSDDSTPPPPTGQQAAVGKSSKAAVTIADPATQDRGGVRNPFKQQHLAKAPATTTGTTTTSTTTPASGDGSPTGGAGSGSGGSGTTQPVRTPSGSGTSTPKSDNTDKLDVFHLTVRVGRADGKLRTLKDVARLSPLPSVDDPFLVYTGILDDGKTAVFLLSSDAKATGDGKCKPKTTDCESVELKKDQTEFFDILVDGKPVQYELDLVDITPAGASDPSSKSTSSPTTGHAAVAAATRHSSAGAELLRKAHVNGSKAYKNADAYRWLPDRGVLVRTPKRGGAQASVTGAVAASPADLAATLPGQPVWHWKLGG